MNKSLEHQSTTHATTSHSDNEQQHLEGEHKSNKDVSSSLSSTTPSPLATTAGMSTGSITECTSSLPLLTSNSITQQQQDRRQTDCTIQHDSKLSASITSSEDNPQRSSTDPITITVQPQPPVPIVPAITTTTATLLPTTVAASTIPPKPPPLSKQPNNTNLTSLVSFPSNCHHQRHFPTNNGNALLLPKNAATSITGAPTAATISATPLLQQQQQSNGVTHNSSANLRSGNVPLLPTPTPTTAATTSQFIVPTLQQQAAVAMAASSNISISPQQQQQLFLQQQQQQHAAAVAAATAAAMAQQNGSPYGGVGYTHLRSGKWLPAEENYALLLVALFERGMITDCVDGTTTLRTYLSQKLHCAPMRISKKFAGRGIGKLTYASKTMASSPNGQQKIPELLDRLRIAEQQFLQAAYPPPVTASLGIIPFPLLQAASNSNHQQQFPMFPTPLLPGMVPNPKLIPPPPQQQMVASTSATIASEAPIAPTITSSSTTVPIQATTELHESYLRALQQADDEASNTDTKPTANSDGAMATETMPSASSIEIPDLLSGFEKVVQGMKETTPTTTSSEKEKEESNAVVTSNEYSPPFTSRSFDEFHRFLGKDEISLLDTVASSPPQEVPYVNQNTHVTVNALKNNSIQNPIVAIDTNPLFSAESYAMITQESSLQASRHGTTYSIPPLQNGGRNNAHDVESILQQIHTHRTHREPPRKSETMSTNSSLYGTGSSSISNPSSAAFHYGHLNNANLPMNVTIPNHHSNVGPLSNPPATKVAPVTNSNRNHHVTATSQSEDVNIVSGSDPSGGSSSSRSNTSNTSSGTDTTGGTTSNEDDGSEEEGLTSSGAEFDSAEDDDINNNTNVDVGGNGEASNSNKKDNKLESSASRKRSKGSNNNNSHNSNHHQQRRGAEGTTATSTTKKKVKFQ